MKSGVRKKKGKKKREERREGEGNFLDGNNTAMGTSSTFANDNGTMPSMAVHPGFMVHPVARHAS